MQVPASFLYAKATSIDHALSLLAEHGEEARVIAGGHSLLPMMKLRLAKPDALIDINGLTDLAFIRVDGDTLRVGALTRHADIFASAVVGEHFPLLHDAEKVIADPIVRNWGTIGGSLCQADPAEDIPAALVAAEHTDPTADQRGPEDYKRHLAAELTTRALRRAINRAQGLGA